MTLIVEDGTVVADANSFNTVAQFKTFATNNGATAAAEADDDQVEVALIKAAQYMQQKFRLMWRGSIIEATQSLSWPRRGVPVTDFFDPFYTNINVPRSFQDTYYIPENTVPPEVLECQNLLALETIDSSGQSSGSLQASYGRQTKREKVGSLEVEYIAGGEDGGNLKQTQTYWTAMKIVEPFLRPSTPQTGTILRS
jgi:hypothetical protein